MCKVELSYSYNHISFEPVNSYMIPIISLIATKLANVGQFCPTVHVHEHCIKPIHFSDA